MKSKDTNKPVKEQEIKKQVKVKEQKNQVKAEDIKQQINLTPEEQVVLNKHIAKIIAIRKLIKKQKKAFRYERIVFRLKARLPINASRTYYPFRKKDVDELRVKVPKKAVKSRRSARRSKNMAIALLLLLLIVGALGFGSYYIYKMITDTETNRVVTGEVVFVNESSINVPVENARLNKNIEKPVIIKNKVNAPIFVRFKAEITAADGKPATGDLEELEIRYVYDMSKWYFDSSENYLYYKGALPRDTELQPITHFQIYSVNSNENKWVGRTVGVKFTVEVEQTSGNGKDAPNHWSSGWKNIMDR